MEYNTKLFNKYLICYGADEARTGVKGIRSDAPAEAIEEYLEWFRDNNRYPNGRKYNKDSKFVRDQIIDVTVDDVDPKGFAS